MSEPLPTAHRSLHLRPVALGLAGALACAVALWFGLHARNDNTPLPAPSSPIAPEVPAVSAPVPSTIAPTAPPPSQQLALTPPAAPPAPPPAPPAVTPAITPSFDVVRIEPSGDAVLAGRSAPGADIVVTDNGKQIGRATANEQGQWVILPSAPLLAGGQELAVTATEAGGQQTNGDAPVLLIVPPTGQAGRGTAPAAVAILTPPNGAPRLLAPVDPAKAKLGLDIVDYDEHGLIRFSGTAPPGVTVRVYIDQALAGDALANAQGLWTLVPGKPIAAGNHQLRLDQLAAGGKVAARLALPFQRAELTGQEAADGHVIVQPSQNLWRIARRIYGRGTQYLTIYKANRDQIRDPGRIYPGQVFAVPASPASSAANPAAPMPVSSSKSR